MCLVAGWYNCFWLTCYLHWFNSCLPLQWHSSCWVLNLWHSASWSGENWEGAHVLPSRAAFSLCPHWVMVRAFSLTLRTRTLLPMAAAALVDLGADSLSLFCPLPSEIHSAHPSWPFIQQPVWMEVCSSRYIVLHRKSSIVLSLLQKWMLPLKMWSGKPKFQVSRCGWVAGDQGIHWNSPHLETLRLP